jgi:hypothetical protein
MAAGSELPVRLRRLLPEPGSLTADEAVEQLRFGEYASDARPFVAVNMVATVDGRAVSTAARRRCQASPTASSSMRCAHVSMPCWSARAR